MTTTYFVFGSNLAGRHGAGAALEARQKWGAIYGCGEGLQGYSYGIPTKDRQIQPRSLIDIKISVIAFIEFAREMLDVDPTMEFLVSRIGCGLAGYKDHQIGPMFATAPKNCTLPANWEQYRKGTS